MIYRAAELLPLLNAVHEPPQSNVFRHKTGHVLHAIFFHRDMGSMTSRTTFEYGKIVEARTPRR